MNSANICHLVPVTDSQPTKGEHMSHPQPLWSHDPLGVILMLLIVVNGCEFRVKFTAVIRWPRCASPPAAQSDAGGFVSLVLTAQGGRWDKEKVFM